MKIYSKYFKLDKKVFWLSVAIFFVLLPILFSINFKEICYKVAIGHRSQKINNETTRPTDFLRANFPNNNTIYKNVCEKKSAFYYLFKVSVYYNGNGTDTYCSSNSYCAPTINPEKIKFKKNILLSTPLIYFISLLLSSLFFKIKNHNVKPSL